MGDVIDFNEILRESKSKKQLDVEPTIHVELDLKQSLVPLIVESVHSFDLRTRRKAVELGIQVLHAIGKIAEREGGGDIFIERDDGTKWRVSVDVDKNPDAKQGWVSQIFSFLGLR